jgi:hypothetical protein
VLDDSGTNQLTTKNTKEHKEFLEMKMHERKNADVDVFSFRTFSFHVCIPFVLLVAFVVSKSGK